MAACWTNKDRAVGGKSDVEGSFKAHGHFESNSILRGVERDVNAKESNGEYGYTEANLSLGVP